MTAAHPHSEAYGAYIAKHLNAMRHESLTVHNKMQPQCQTMAPIAFANIALAFGLCVVWWKRGNHSDPLTWIYHHWRMPTTPQGTWATGGSQRQSICWFLVFIPYWLTLEWIKIHRDGWSCIPTRRCSLDYSCCFLFELFVVFLDDDIILACGGKHHFHLILRVCFPHSMKTHHMNWIECVPNSQSTFGFLINSQKYTQPRPIGSFLPCTYYVRTFFISLFALWPIYLRPEYSSKT